jgi:MFS family permease
VIASAYFVGMLIGCLATPRIIAHAGHIRAFSAFVAVSIVTSLMYPLFVEPVAWALIRAVTGFCFAGLYATIESWLHDKAENAVRGQVLALYQIVHYAGSATGQQAIRFITPSSFVPFSMVACALALSVLPLAYTRSDPPEPPPVPRLRLGWLFRISPVGVVGALISGIANGTFWSLAPVFAERSGLGAGGVASFMTAAIIGGAAVQWPIGRLADRSDRRYIMLVAIALAVAAQAALVWYAKSDVYVLSVLAALVGASALVLYPLSSSHTQDLGGRENAVEVSTGLLLAYTIGAIVGPTTAAWLMGQFGPEWLFIHNIVVHVTFVIFIVWRLWQRPGRPEMSV